jgi:hypothetical protein
VYIPGRMPGEIDTVVWVGKPSENTDFRQENDPQNYTNFSHKFLRFTVLSLSVIVTARICKPSVARFPSYRCMTKYRTSQIGVDKNKGAMETLPSLRDEQWFSILKQKRFRVVDFPHVETLAERIRTFIRQWNEQAPACKWTPEAASQT